MSKFNIKTHWPILAGIAIIYVFAMIYFMPIMQGKVLQSHDMISSVGDADQLFYRWYAMLFYRNVDLWNEYLGSISRQYRICL